MLSQTNRTRQGVVLKRKMLAHPELDWVMLVESHRRPTLRDEVTFEQTGRISCMNDDISKNVATDFPECYGQTPRHGRVRQGAGPSGLCDSGGTDRAAWRRRTLHSSCLYLLRKF